MRAIAEGLVLGATAGAPPVVLALFNSDGNGSSVSANDLMRVFDLDGHGAEGSVELMGGSMVCPKGKQRKHSNSRAAGDSSMSDAQVTVGQGTTEMGMQ